MNWSIKFGTIFGIDLKVHITFFLILLWGAFSYGGSAGPLYGIVVILSLFTLVILHELGHSVAAMGFGIPVKDITLLPIGGVARLERMPEKPIQELIVALAGPMVNVVLGGMLLPIVLALTAAQGVTLSLSLLTEPGVLGLLTFLLGANVTLVVFNMIPAFPLDGGRVFRAAMGFFTNYENATNIAVTVGRLLAIALGIFAVINGQLFMALIAFFIFVAGGQEGQAVKARGFLRKIKVGQALRANSVALSPYATVGQVAAMMMSNRQRNYAVLDPVNGDLMGVATKNGVTQAMKRGQWHWKITEIMQHATTIPKIALSATLADVQDKLTDASSQVIAVYDGLHFRGLLTSNDIYRAFQFPQGGYSGAY